jgi:hypothetical protein
LKNDFDGILVCMVLNLAKKLYSYFILTVYLVR